MKSVNKDFSYQILYKNVCGKKLYNYFTTFFSNYTKFLNIYLFSKYFYPSISVQHIAYRYMTDKAVKVKFF